MVYDNEIKSKTFPQYFAALSATGGALATGTLLGWTSPAQNKVTDGSYGFPVSADEFSWVGSAMTLGAAFSCIPTGFLINIIGRKWTMLSLVAPFTVGWCLLIWAQNLPMLYVSRFILGMSGGAFCVAAPMYNGEIAQNDIRGALGSYFQLMLTLGILFIYAIGAGLNVFWMSVVCGIIPLIFGGIFFFMPESPLYLVSKNKNEQAVKSIQWLRGKEYNYLPEIQDLKEADSKLKQNRESMWRALGRPVCLKAMGISMGLMAIQQLCGINAVIFYTNDIFEDAQTDISSTLSTCIVGIMQFSATFVASMVVDKLGRRLLLLVSAIFMILSLVGLGLYFFMKEQDPSSVTDLGWLPITSLCIFTILYSIGFGPVPWLVMGELFAPNVKGFAGSIAGTTNWLLAFVVTKTFVNLQNSLGKGETFWFYGGIAFVGLIFVFFFVPETKGKSLTEIQILLAGQNHIEPTTSNTNINITEDKNNCI